MAKCCKFGQLLSLLFLSHLHAFTARHAQRVNSRKQTINQMSIRNNAAALQLTNRFFKGAHRNKSLRVRSGEEEATKYGTDWCEKHANKTNSHVLSSKNLYCDDKPRCSIVVMPPETLRFKHAKLQFRRNFKVTTYPIQGSERVSPKKMMMANIVVKTQRPEQTHCIK